MRASELDLNSPMFNQLEVLTGPTQGLGICNVLLIINDPDNANSNTSG